MIYLENIDQFKCKCDHCRNTCCKLWDITLTEEEYFKLMNFACSDTLKEKLYCAFSQEIDCDPLHYAIVYLNYYGKCPLLDENSYCTLQKECVVCVLPSIYRIYPRNKRNRKVDDFVLSLFCEQVVEMLLKQDYVLKFINSDLIENKISSLSNEEKIKRNIFNLLHKKRRS